MHTSLRFPIQMDNLKRLLDITISLLGLILLSPLFGLIALAIRLESPGSVIFKHRRIGKGGSPFYLLKFRSMVSGGDDAGYMRYLSELIESERNGNTTGLPYRKMAGDSRVTRVGKVLRTYYLDELPQLVNILLGHMSLVGPRPHVQFEVDNYTYEQYRRLTVKPGATGLWQVQGKADCTFNELIQLDLDYIDQRNLWLDMEIIAKTGFLMLRGGEGFWARMAKLIPARKPMLPIPETGEVEDVLSMPVSMDNG
jgi:lipopolysaccharide/colanic/teichoic acid biosynthesis glycosyltransferase